MNRMGNRMVWVLVPGLVILAVVGGALALGRLLLGMPGKLATDPHRPFGGAQDRQDADKKSRRR